jgi:hypothetical protein
VSRRILEFKEVEATGRWKNYEVRDFIISTVHVLLQDDETKKYGMGDACSTHWEAEKGLHNFNR